MEVLVLLFIGCFILAGISMLLANASAKASKKHLGPLIKKAADATGKIVATGADVAVSAATAVAREHDKAKGTDYANRIASKRETVRRAAEVTGKLVGGGAVLVGINVVARGGFDVEEIGEVFSDGVSPEDVPVDEAVGTLGSDLCPPAPASPMYPQGELAPLEFELPEPEPPEPEPPVTAPSFALAPDALVTAPQPMPVSTGGAIFTGGEQTVHVPWSQNTPNALAADWDHDGIPDALDDHVGPGAQAEPTPHLPWAQNAPDAMRLDWDHDGIPDALDRKWGSGKA